MSCTVVNSQAQLKSRLPSLPQTLPTTQAQWTQFLNTLTQWGIALQQEQHPPNVIPSQFQTFTTAASSAVIGALTVSDCVASIDTGTQYYGAASLKVSAIAAGATLAFTGFPIAIAAATRWFGSFQILAPSGCAGSLAIKTSAGHTLTESFTVLASASWQQVWGLFDLRAYPDTQATWQFTFTSTAGVWLDGMQMNAVGDPLANLPRFAGTQMVTGALAYASNLDGVPDGSTYERMPGANMDGNRRGLIDWSSTGHINGVGTLTPRGTCVVSASGTVISKPTGASAWDSDATAQQSFLNGCFVTWRASEIASDTMVGFSKNPAASVSYTSLDFGLYQNGSTIQIYEAGNLVLAAGGSYAIGDTFEVRYDGVTVRYFHNGALLRAVRAPGLKLTPKVCMASPGAVITDFACGPASAVNQPGGNWLNTYPWVVGTSGSQGNYSDIGGVQPSKIFLSGSSGIPLGPYGTSEPIWFAYGGQSGPCGGWNNSGDLYGIDPTKTYRSVVWFWWNGVGTTAEFFHGCDSNQTNNLDGTQNTNPYFSGNIPLSGLARGKWYMSVGIIHGSGYAGGQSGISGIYDPTTGQLIIAGLDFKSIAGAPNQTQRVYNFYDTNASSGLGFTKPRFEEANGNEPSIQALLAPAAALQGFVTTGQCVFAHETASKQGGGTSWDSAVYAVHGYTSAHIQAKPNAATDHAMVGFATNPAATAYASGGSYAFPGAYLLYNGAGTWEIYESDTQVYVGGSVSASDLAEVTYDGSNFRYYVNKVLLKTTAAAGLTVYGYMTIYDPGAGWNSINYGPTTTLAINDLDTQVSDGSTYLRMPGSNMDGNRRALIDLSQAGHIGTLTATKLGPGTLDSIITVGAGQILYDNGAVMRVTGTGFGSANQFVDWFGPHLASITSCTEANATWYLKTNGSAYFGGALSAGTLTTSASTSDTSSTAFAETAVFGSNGGTITVTFSYTFSSDGFAPDGSGTNSCTIQLYRSYAGGAYALVATLNASGSWSSTGSGGPGGWGSGNSACSGSTSYTDPDHTTSNRQYKAVISSRSCTVMVDAGLNSVISQRVSVVCVEP